MSSTQSATPYLVMTALIAAVFLCGKIVLEYEGEKSIEQVQAKIKKCTVASSNKSAAARSNFCKVELKSGEIISVTWFGQVPMNYVGQAILEKSEEKYSGKNKYKLIRVANENHS